MRSNIDPPSPKPDLRADTTRPGRAGAAAQASLTIAITIEASRQAIRIAMVTTQIQGTARS
jgi:hypothetical protein